MPGTLSSQGLLRSETQAARAQTGRALECSETPCGRAVPDLRGTPNHLQRSRGTGRQPSTWGIVRSCDPSVVSGRAGIRIVELKLIDDVRLVPKVASDRSRNLVLHQPEVKVDQFSILMSRLQALGVKRNGK